MKLYEHQRELFKVIKRDTNKVVLYQAPTGKGKTMSPIGLAEGKKIIFTCGFLNFFVFFEFFCFF